MSMETKHVSALIDILMNPNNDWKQMVINIAKTHPEVVLQSAGSAELRFPDLAEHLNRGKISTIQYVRNEAGISLKEAKEFVDDYCLFTGWRKS